MHDGNIAVRLRAWAGYLDEAGLALYRVRDVASNVGDQAVAVAASTPSSSSAAVPPAPATLPVPVTPPGHTQAAAMAVGADAPVALRLAALLAAPRPDLAAVRAELGDCRRCGLCATRQTIVFGEGNPDAHLMFVGEGPGADEDATGRPFVGKAGQLLDKMIAAMGFVREQVYIANIVKCRPPGNRDPEAGEVSQCLPFLLKQIAAIRPRVLVTLGRPATHALLDYDGPMGRVRGAWQTLAGMDVMPTWHPAYLLRNPAAKRDAWNDLKAVMARLSL